jgi:hypothetical protein
MPKFGKYSLLLMNRDDKYCRGFIGGSRDLICVNKSCAIISHSKPSSKWVQPERVVFVHPAIKVARLLTAFVLPDTVLSGNGLPEDVLWTASDATKTPKQWLTKFMPFARMKAAEMCRLKEEDEEEEESLADYQFGMEVDVPDGPMGVTWEPIPIVIYPPFMAEEEVKRLGDDGLYATEIREAISGVRERLTDAQLAARADAETLVEYVDRSSNWLMEHVDILHCCGDRLQTAVGDIAALTAQFPYPTLAKSVYNLLSQVEDLRTHVNSQVDGVFEDIKSVDADLKLHIPLLRQELDSLGRRAYALEQHCSTATLSVDLTSSSVIRDPSSGHPLISLGELISQLANLKSENSNLRAQIGALGGASLGSSSFGAHVFTSTSELETVLVNEMPTDGLVFVELFVDINTMPCHNANVDPGNALSLLTWDKATKDMILKGYTAAARKVIRSFQEIVSSLYTDGKEALPGQKIAAFKSPGSGLVRKGGMVDVRG